MDTMEHISIGAQCKMVSSISPTPTSANAQLRKIKKPLIEKRRRERINECLVQLKALVLEAMNKDGSQYSKMEKADILEMTVAHLKSICGGTVRPRSADSTADTTGSPPSTVHSSSPAAVQRYMSGYTECAVEVANYLSTSVSAELTSNAPRNVGDTVRRGLLEHLDSCLHRQTTRLTPGLTAGVSSSSLTSAAKDVEERLLVSTERTWSPRALAEHAGLSSLNGRWKTSTEELEEERFRDSTIGVERLTYSADQYAAIIAAKTSMCPRARYDSGVYSGASSPTGDAGSAVAGDETTSTIVSCWAAGKDWASSSSSPQRLSISPSTLMASAVSSASETALHRQHNYQMFEFLDAHECRRQQQQQVLNLTTRTTNSDDVWRPW